MQLVTKLLLSTVLVAAVPTDRVRPHGVAQQLIQSDSTLQQQSARGSRKLTGKFLHITDFHPDPFYKIHTDPNGDHPCHQGEDKNQLTGYYGAPTTSCDSPFSLINATFKWIQENIKDEIDFVIWTGDSARHDNDDDIPRHNHQVLDQNQYLVDKFVEVFGKRDRNDDEDPTNDFLVPIVPTLGNNDMLPHNIFMPGPNSWTKNYEVMWKQFIPEEQKHSFARGGWFWTEVIPNKLAVISLNTMYFFASNAAVDGCDLKSEPGYEHMEWLRIQLQFLRERGLKAMLIGHVPPARTEGKQNWDETCYQKYVLWLRQYRDVIVGSFYGHMNIDHFMFHDVQELKYEFDIDGLDEKYEDKSSGFDDNESREILGHEFHTTGKGKADYLNELRAVWSKLPPPPHGVSYGSGEDSVPKSRQKDKDDFYKDIGGPFGERFSMSIVSPSVVPNYFPSLRIIEYNTTGLEHEHPAIGSPRGHDAKEEDLHFHRIPYAYDREEQSPEDEKNADDISADKKHKKKKSGKKKHNKHPKVKPNFPVPLPPTKSVPPGPAYSPQTFSLVSWSQFYANLSSINTKMASKADSDASATTDITVSKNQDPFSFEVEYITNQDKTYELKDLTVKHWLGFAQSMGQALDNSKGNIFEVDSEADSPAIDDEDVDPNKKKKKKKHGKKKHNKIGKLKSNKLWHLFVRRAFVLSLGDEDLEGDFD